MWPHAERGTQNTRKQLTIREKIAHDMRHAPTWVVVLGGLVLILALPILLLGALAWTVWQIMETAIDPN